MFHNTEEIKLNNRITEIKIFSKLVQFIDRIDNIYVKRAQFNLGGQMK